MTQSKFNIEWIDAGREPQNPPDPRFPDGVDIRLHLPGAKTCIVQLPYPAARCGLYKVECTACKARVGVTTAGRPDDPRSVEIYCNLKPAI